MGLFFWLKVCALSDFQVTKEEIEKICSAEEWWFKQFGNHPWF